MNTVQIIQNGKGFQWQETDENGVVTLGSVVWDTVAQAKLAYGNYLSADLVSRLSQRVLALAGSGKWQGGTLSVNKS